MKSAFGDAKTMPLVTEEQHFSHGRFFMNTCTMSFTHLAFALKSSACIMPTNSCIVKNSQKVPDIMGCPSIINNQLSQEKRWKQGGIKIISEKRMIMQGQQCHKVQKEEER